MNPQKLLEHQITKFGAVDVMDVLLKDTETGDPVMFLDTLKITSINQEASQKEIKGGIGAPDLIIYDYARVINVEIQDALASIASLQLLWGGEALDNVEYTAIFEATAGTGGEITVPAELTVVSGAKAFVLSAQKGVAADGTVAGDKITATGIQQGDVVKVFIPATENASAENGFAALAINSLNMPPTVHLVGHTFFIDQATGKKVFAEIEIPLLKINVSGGLTMEAEGDAAVFDFNGRALADPVSKNFFLIKLKGKE